MFPLGKTGIIAYIVVVSKTFHIQYHKKCNHKLLSCPVMLRYINFDVTLPIKWLFTKKIHVPKGFIFWSVGSEKDTIYQ